MCDHENSDIRDMVEVDKGRGLLGNLQVSKTKVNSKTNKLKENSLETEKVFQAGEKHY